ncbi:mannose-6-phosphate isomerase [Pseudochelatococcus lubricantis]|uniref:Mannose-6-phosphate isomerase n=1 Tax=Pseudochelatococcus lubricantis TaxID=1538102 RepID=A0ABX0UY62_9HYPH|nr:AGE family epimerase/isomerase [Pseudochelatococcus lubricantis]NIJ57871.1 mannose-6-phosphate isomerase [Pseudochelatococcus lubricantis]
MNVTYSDMKPDTASVANGSLIAGEELRDTTELKETLGLYRKVLFEQILPLWSTVGADHARGGYAETLSARGRGAPGPRRVRVTARQVYAMCEAAELGWNRLAAEAGVRHGCRFLALHTSAGGFLFHTLAADDSVSDIGFDLYDQAFLLFAHAHAWRLLRDPDIVERARLLRQSVVERFAHADGGFVDRLDKPFPLRSNPHMHLLEASLAWLPLDPDPRWRELADTVVALFLSRFVDRERGILRETFGADWTPVEDAGRCRVEPGHNYEWAWLLMRWEALTGGDAGAFPLGMVGFAETHGYDPLRRVAVNEVWSDGSASDGKARLWPQTERLKAWLAVARRSQGPDRWRAEKFALDAAGTLMSYLQTPVAGLWHDVMLEDGSFAAGDAPGSSLYHIICAIGELQRYVDSREEYA